MKKIGLLVVVFAFLPLLSGVAWADCESDCEGPFQTCLNLCRQTTKEDSPEAARCVDGCFHGLSGCQKRCNAKSSKVENNKIAITTDLAVPASFVAFNTAPADSCIEQGQTCVLHGTACCAPYECKGKFPNTTCQ